MCEKCYGGDSIIIIEREDWGAASIVIRVNLDCIFVHVQSDLMNICVRKSIHLFMTVTSNYCMN